MQPNTASGAARAANQTPTVAVSSEITAALARGAVVAIGVSGGKDSQALALRVMDYLDAIGHTGPRVLVHSDLGLVEWRASGPLCERLSKRLGVELLTVKREKGGLMERWEQRWASNLRRYANLECMKIILPWSTPAMRFCTSELKTAVISAALTKKYPGSEIISAIGIRREESSSRAKMPVSGVQEKLKARRCSGFFWNAIIEWTKEDVLAYLRDKGEELHPAYTVYGSSRVSCQFCIMGNARDLAAAASCPDNHEIYRRMVSLEIKSTFAFQGARWLADVAPDLLDEATRTLVNEAKQKSILRASIEQQIPKDLLYSKGWPTRVPTFEEAVIIAHVRREVAALLSVWIDWTTPEGVISRFQELLDKKP